MCARSSPPGNSIASPFNPRRNPAITAEDIARECAAAAADKKAEDVVVLDLRGISTFTDYYVICSGSSEPQIKAIAAEIQEQLREKFQTRPAAVDGFPVSQWVILDYLSVLVHIFAGDKRAYYALEDLWGDAPKLELEDRAVAGLERAEARG